MRKQPERQIDHKEVALHAAMWALIAIYWFVALTLADAR